MALVSEYISAAELAAFDEDKPVLIGSHAVDWPRWRDASLSGTADLAEPGFEGFWAADRAGLASSKPIEGLAEINLVFALTAPAGFDVLAIFGNLGEPATIDADIADDAAFTTNVQPLLVDTVPTGNRFVAWHLGDDSTPQRFSGTGYGRIKFTGAGIPEIRELWIGRRRQMRRYPDNPFDGEATNSRTASPGDEFGAELALPLYFGRGSLRATFTTATEEEAAEVRAWHRECGHGTRPFLWCEKPKTKPHHVGIYLGRPGLAMPLSGPTSRTFTVEGLEQTPFMVDAPPILPPAYTNTASLHNGGTISYMTVPASASLDASTAKMTLSYWIRKDSIWGGEMVARVGAWGTTFNSNGRINFSLGSGAGASIWQTPTNTVAFGTWYHVVWVYDSAAASSQVVRCWVNSTEITLAITGANRVMTTPTGALNVFLRSGATNPATNIYIDELAIWIDRAMTPTEVIAIGPSPKDLSIYAPTSYWRFENNYQDSVGPNHGTPIGTTLTFDAAVPA